MKKSIIYLPILVLLCCFRNSFAQQNNTTQILVLGTHHLEHYEGFEPNMANQLLDHLDQKDFEVIGLEQMPTQLFYDLQSRQDANFQELYTSVGKRRVDIADQFQERLNISFPKARDSIKTILHQERFSPKDRNTLISLFLARGDVYSAVLQSDYLKQENNTIREDEISSKILEDYRDNNENYTLGVALAKRENLQRLEYIDNLQDMTYLQINFPNFMTEYTHRKTELDSLLSLNGIFEKVNLIAASALQEKNVMPLYEFLNSKEYASKDYNAQWRIWFRTNFASEGDKARFYLWEMRNLQIVANILSLVAKNPGKKIIIIIGSSHKSFLEKYLMQIENIEVLEFK